MPPGCVRRSSSRRRRSSRAGREPARRSGSAASRAGLARGPNPPGIRAAMHPRWPLRFTRPRCKVYITLCNVCYTFCHSKAALCVAPRANSAAIPPSSRLASPAPRRSRCSGGFSVKLGGRGFSSRGVAHPNRRGHDRYPRTARGPYRPPVGSCSPTGGAPACTPLAACRPEPPRSKLSKRRRTP